MNRCIKYNHPMMMIYFYYRTEKSQEPIRNLFLLRDFFSLLSLSHPIECRRDISQTFFFKPSVCVYIFTSCRQSFQIGSLKLCYFIEKDMDLNR
jgi:hypothetical protein